MSVSSTVGIPTAFIFGVASFLSPCVLPLVPAYLSYMSGATVEELMNSERSDVVRQTGLKSLFFVLGFSLVFVAMGATATSIGKLLSNYMLVLTRIGGIIIIGFGLQMLGIFRIRALYTERRFHLKLKKAGLVGAFLIGVTFAFGWTPCVGPVLAGILTLAADSKTVWQGILLLSMYSIGLGIPFLITGFATGAALRVLSVVKRHVRLVEVASGLLMVLVGILIFSGRFQILSAFISRWISLPG